jgi:hypothetical protein
MKTHRTFATLLSLPLLAAMGCEPSEETRVPLDPDPAAELAVSNLSPYDGVMGNKEVMVFLQIDREIVRTELVCDDAAEPAASADGLATTLQWDSMRCSDGIVALKVRAVDEDDNVYESQAVQVIVVNGGRVAFLAEGTSGTIRIPTDYNGTQEVDVKHHWDNPAVQTRAIGVATWIIPDGEPTWFIEGSMGCGVCPHSGTTWGQPEESTASPLVLDIRASDIGQTWLDTTQAFFHLRPLDAGDHLGENLGYSMAVYLFQ